MFDKAGLVKEANAFIISQLNIPEGHIDAGRDLKSIGLDSFRIIELVLFLERKTGKSFPDFSYTPANLKSVDSIVNCFISRKGER